MLRNYTIGAILLLSASLAFAAEAGRVVFVTGQTQVGGRAAVLDAAVQEGDDLTTGADGYIYVKTVDSGFLILRPNSKARVVAYQIDQQNPGNTRVKLELSQGVARAISGHGVKQARQNFRFNTPVAAIGVRGTDFVVYTDSQTSRVQVMSGGVVMSPFSDSCVASGVGPCEGRASRELFAGQAGLLLQVQRGQQTPQLLNNPALAPDQSEKPRADEPVGKVTQAAVLTPAQVNLDPRRSDLSLDALRPAGQSTGNNGVDSALPPPVVVTPPPVEPPVVVVPPVVEPPAPLPPKAQEVFWGRWTSVAGAAVMPAAIKNNNVETPIFVGDYAIARTNGATLVMPTEGTVAFNLANSEAYVQKPGAAQMRAVVDTGKLSINFVDRSFTTDLGISSGVDKYDISGRGLVDYKGVMSNTSNSATQIRGYLSGPNVEEAAYIFKNTSYPNTTVIGATSWKR
ncbi:FecR family protein [Duganella sp.]|uniref:FecR family protein n=1 Tax=Duganella sp. TaxID=1904440 RepID=UPI0031DD365E